MQLAPLGFRHRVRKVEEAGLAYELNIILDLLVLGLPTEPVLKDEHRPGNVSPTQEEAEEVADDTQFDEDTPAYRKYLSKLCPKTWRDQDHYKVLGLSKLRYRATAGQIKTSYRQKVLRYHPDKGKFKSELGEKANDMFACIQKAYELMFDESKRRAYDSVDSDFDERVPEANEVSAKNFYLKLGPVFERNARFSRNQPVPLLGDENSSRSDVEHFYEFWFAFSSWREFSYLDAEDKSKGEDRYERREIEKQNKVEREKLRKADVKRITNLIQMTYDKDPRIVAFKKQDKQKKEEEKERKRLEKLKLEEEKKAAELEEQRQKELELERQREEKRKADKVKQAEKKITAAKRKRLREIARKADYWTTDPGQKLHIMEQIERICLEAENNQLDEVCEKLETAKEYDATLEMLRNTAKKEAPKAVKKESAQTETKDTNWSEEQIALLIKGANMFPAGTSRRWFQVAQYINDHCRGSTPKTEKEVIKQAKMQAAQVTAPGVMASKTEKTADAAPTTAKPAAAASASLDDWSPDEQMKFERALKEIPAADPKRWEKIGEATGRTKKECIQRYKKIVEMLKARKA